MNLARKRLTRKLLVVFTAPVVLGFAVAALGSVRATREALFESSERSLADNIATLRAAALPFAAKATKDDLAGLVERVAAEESVHGAALYDERAAVVARSGELGGPAPDVDAMVSSTIAGGAPVERTMRLHGADVLVRAEPVRGAAGIGAVVMTYSLAPVMRMIDSALFDHALAGGAVALVVSLIAFFIARVLGRELGSLVHAAERVAVGDLDARVVASPLLELDRVARSFNEMTRSLVDAREKLLSAEAERLELDARIRHAQALAVVGQVAGSFAHEIGSPLNTILGWSRLSAADEGLPPAVRRQFETIAAQCERITRIVQRLLGIARPPTDKVVSVQLADVVREVTAFLAPDLRVRRVDLRVLVAERVPTIRAVRDRVLQVVMNLCVNAIQAQPGGGTLRISLGLADHEDGEWIKLEVADAGPGIPDSVRDRIFELFFSTKVERGGTGLGLPIVADIVRDLGGKVEVGSAPEGGALFRVLLPTGAAAR